MCEIRADLKAMIKYQGAPDAQSSQAGQSMYEARLHRKDTKWYRELGMLYLWILHKVVASPTCTDM